jgi:ABC-type transporter MlaC component
MFVQAQVARSVAVVIGQPPVVNRVSMTHGTWKVSAQCLRGIDMGRTEQSGIIPSMETTGVVGVIVDCAIVAVTSNNAVNVR